MWCAMVENRTEMAREWLEGKRAGAFADVVRVCLEKGGVVHCSPDCFLAGYPCEDNPACLLVVFQCSRLVLLRELLGALPFERVRWHRDYGHGCAYGERERAIADFWRHDDWGTGKFSKDNKKGKKRV